MLGEGFHAKAGTGHAEVVAMRNAEERGNSSAVKGSTVYTTLGEFILILLKKFSKNK